MDFSHGTPVDWTYEEVRGIVVGRVTAFLEIRPDMDEHEAWSAAGLGFAQAYMTYDLNKGAFTTWVWDKVEKALLTAYRNQSKRRARMVTLGEYDEAVPFDTDEEDEDLISVKDWKRTLSKDAAKLATLALKPPKQVQTIVDRLGDTPANWRYAIRQFVRDLGWTATRIRDAFSEVKESL